MSPDERLAVIDLGSNSFRLVVFMAGDGWWKRTDEIYEAVRIGEGLAASGKLGREPMARAMATLGVFAQFSKASGLAPEAVDVLATSAIRDAENAEDFLARARELSGLPIRVLSREQEARYGYLAAVNSTTLTDGCVLDLGGGSMQLVHVVDRLARESGSWRVGTVRMSERFLPVNGPAKRRQLEALSEHVAEQLAEADWLAQAGGSAGGRLIGIGGTVRNLAAAAQRAAGLPSNGVQGMVLERDALAELVQRLAALPAAERASVPGVKPARADLILAGAVVVRGVLLAGGFDGLEATEAGLREGVFFERLLSADGPLSTHGRLPADGRLATDGQLASDGSLATDGSLSTDGPLSTVGPPSSDASRSASASPERPPLFEDVRRASVLNLAGQYHFDVAHTRHVAALALGMFDELASVGLHDGDPRERELLWAASMLHDIGMSVDYDDHHKHSRYLILNAGLPGFSPVEVAIIAQAARYHRKGMPDPGPLRALFGEGDAERLDRCAVLLRLAEDLERSRDQLVRGTSIVLSSNEVELRLIADGESVVPRWAAKRETALFARAFHRELAVAS